MKLAVSFTNFGPYHLARLRALAIALAQKGGRLLAVETAGTEGRYPWRPARQLEPFEWVTLFPQQALENLPRAACASAIRELYEREEPDAVGIVGYTRPESIAALTWARERAKPTILMSESQAVDHPRVWWKEAIKRRRVEKFSAALVGGPSHRDYLVDLGMPPERIAFGYDAVDNALYARLANQARNQAQGDTAARGSLPRGPFFLCVSRMVPEKNLVRLVHAYAGYRKNAREGHAWQLAICGAGPSAGEIAAAAEAHGCASDVIRPGFLQAGALARWYAFASAFVHSSLMEPWGLVVNEAAACGLPLLVSERAGCAETLVPNPAGTTGLRFDPEDEDALAEALTWVAALPEAERAAMGQRAAEVVSAWGPDRFAEGTLEALSLAIETEEQRARANRRSTP